MSIRRLEDLEAWKESIYLCKGIYIVTSKFPLSEKYNIIKHLRESGRGVAGNIGEGFGRYFFRESMQFYGIARGCLYEIKSDIYLSHHLSYINQELLDKFIGQINLVDQKLGGLLKSTKFQLNKEK